jgi:type I site-specific restriction-modification system R (restriction) subunit
LKKRLAEDYNIMPADTSEKGLETLIMQHMTGTDGLAPVTTCAVAETTPLSGGTGWIAGDPQTYDRAHAIDTAQLFAFLLATQPEETGKLGIADYRDRQNMAHLKFLSRLSGEIAKRGVIDVLRHGIKHGALSFDLFYGTPSPGNEKAAALFAKNRFSITRQLRYSQDETKRAIDLCLFINGLPLSTFELKNNLTKQTAADAEEQYRCDRNPRERLFEFGRCIVHFALDEKEVRMCTELKGKAKAFCRTYDFLASILPYNSAEWEKLSIFLNYLIPRLPAPKEEDLAKGILEAIDMDSYRAEKKAAIKLTLPDKDAEIEPVPVEGGGRKPEPEMDRLTNIIRQFNDLFGNIPWTNADRARRLVKQFSDNESFRRWLSDTSFELTYFE